MGRSSFQGTPWHYETLYSNNGKKKEKAFPNKNDLYMSIPDRIGGSSLSEFAKEQFYHKPYCSFDTEEKALPFCKICKKETAWMFSEDNQKIICLSCGRETGIQDGSEVPFVFSYNKTIYENITNPRVHKKKTKMASTSTRKKKKKSKKSHGTSCKKI